MDMPLEKKRKTPVLILKLLAVPAVILPAAVLAGAFSARSTAVDAAAISVCEARMMPFREYVIADGYISPLSSEYYSARSEGTVRDTLAAKGDFVLPGDGILLLENPKIEGVIAGIESEIARLESDSRKLRLSQEEELILYREQELELDHEISLLEREGETLALYRAAGGASDREISDNLGELAFLREKRALGDKKREIRLRLGGEERDRIAADIAALRAELVDRRQELSSLRVMAAGSGRIGEIFVSKGEMVSTGRKLLRVDSTGEFKVVARVNEYYATRVGAGTEGSFTLLPDGSQAFVQTLTRIDSDVVDGSFTVEMELKSELPPSVLMGQRVDVKLSLDSRTSDIPVLAIDAGDFMTETGGKWVFTFGQNGRIARRKQIETGRQNTETVEIVGGLEPGEKVITSGYSRLKRFDEVKLSGGKHDFFE